MSDRVTRALLVSLGLLGAAGIALGAFGAHALADTLAARGLENAWETAVLYHLVHVVAALCVVGAGVFADQPLGRGIVIAWLAGIVLFSGSLYGIALGGPRWLGPVTPLGGLAFIAGWLALAVAALRARPRSAQSPPAAGA